MYLSVPNNLPGYEDEAVMELKTNDDDAREGKIELTFLNPKTNNYENSNVYFRFSFIKVMCGKKKQIKPLLFKFI